jgi:putative iron-regulated protein
MPIHASVIAGALLLAILHITACGGGGSSSSTTSSRYVPATVSEAGIKANYVNMARAAYTDSLATALELREQVDAFIAEPTDANLQSARAAYKAMRVPYQQSEIMRWDTAITLPNNLDFDGGPASVDEWEGQVNAWPLDESHIDAIIAGDEQINIALLLSQNGADENEANVTTGVHAIEFMLWGADTHGTGPGAGERPATDYANDGSCGDAYCARRASYLKAAVDLLVADLTSMASEWSEDAEITQGTLAYNFINSTQGLDYILGSMGAMATDELASARMSSGLVLGDPEEEHDCFSDLSHVAIFNNFLGVRNAFYGTYGDIEGESLADMVADKDRGTFDDMAAALDGIENKMQQILQAGERSDNPIRFDQIIGQPQGATEREIAEAAVDELIALGGNLQAIRELLSLAEIDTGGGGDSN